MEDILHPITGPNEKTQLSHDQGQKTYILMHTFHDGELNHEEYEVFDLENIIANGGYTGKCPFDGCESIIQPEDIQGVLSDEFYEKFKREFAKKGARRNTYRRKSKKSRKSANNLPKGL